MSSQNTTSLYFFRLTQKEVKWCLSVVVLSTDKRFTLPFPWNSHIIIGCRGKMLFFPTHKPCCNETRVSHQLSVIQMRQHLLNCEKMSDTS